MAVMDLMERRRILHKVVESGGKTIYLDAGIVVLSEDATTVTIQTSVSKRPISAHIVAIDRSLCNDGNTSYTYGTGGVGGTNNHSPSAGWRANGLSGSASSLYGVSFYTDRVVFSQYSSASPFRGGIEYLYTITTIED